VPSQWKRNVQRRYKKVNANERWDWLIKIIEYLIAIGEDTKTDYEIKLIFHNDTTAFNTQLNDLEFELVYSETGNK
jgi:hypothetical protein